MGAHLRSRSAGIPIDNRTVLARKGPLRRAEAARPCALRAVLSGWFRDGRLRRDELTSDSLRPKPESKSRRELVYSASAHYGPSRQSSSHRTPGPLPGTTGYAPAPSHNRLSTTGSAASNSLGSIRSSAPNAIVARWCVSPSFPWPGSPSSRTPHEQCTHTPVLNCQSAANVSPSEFVCLVCLSLWPLLVHMSVPAFSAGPFRFPAARNPRQFCVNSIPNR